MTVHLYTICWNEADILPFFFRHFDPVVDRYVISDDGSTDGTLDLLRAHPKVEVRRFQRVVADSFVLSQQRYQNEVWRESRGLANWVIITAIDEHLTVAGGLGPYLDRCRAESVTAVAALGYQMLCDDFPDAGETLVETRTRGAPWHRMNKLAIFNPDAVTDTGFARGRHSAQPAGRLVWPRRDALMLWHYKLMGFDRLVERQAAQAKGLGAGDLALRLGAHYLKARDEVRAEWDRFAARAIDLGAPEFDPARPGNHEDPVWWRPGPVARLGRALRRLRGD